jgi:hypothetical protein
MVGACIAHSTKNDAKGERQGIRLFTRPVFDEPIVAGSFVTAHHRKPADSPGFCQVASGDDVAGSGLLVRDLGGGVRASAVRERGVPGQVVIRTPDRRLRVFVSSTLGELAEERRAVARAVSALRLTPVMFEVGARPHPPRDVYRAYVAQSDVFVGLYWQRYGQVGQGMEVSGLEDELELARGLPRPLYVRAPAPDREPRLAEL